jgi:hypothetical protein
MDLYNVYMGPWKKTQQFDSNTAAMGMKSYYWTCNDFFITMASYAYVIVLSEPLIVGKYDIFFHVPAQNFPAKYEKATCLK